MEKKKSIIMLICGFFLLIASIASSVGLLQSCCRIASYGVVNLSWDYIISRNATHTMATNNKGLIEFCKTDATAVIQYAIDAVGGRGGGRILIREGQYTLSTYLDFKKYDYITLEGESWNTVLKTNNGPFNAIYFHGESKEFGPDEEENPNIGCRIANMQIDGGSLGPQWEVWNEKNGIQTRATRYTVFENLWIHHMGRTGLYNTEFSHYNEIRNCLFEYNWRYGASYTSSHTGHVHHNIFRYNKDWGLNWDSTYGRCDNTTIEYNTFLNNGQLELYVVGTSGHPVRNGTIQHNTFTSNATVAAIKFTHAEARVEYGEEIVLRNNTIHYTGTGEQAVRVHDWSINVKIINCSIVSTQSTVHGIRVGGNAHNITIQENFIQGGWWGVFLSGNTNYSKVYSNVFTGQRGVKIYDETAYYIEIKYNDFSQITVQAIDDGGTGTIIEGNKMP